MIGSGTFTLIFIGADGARSPWLRFAAGATTGRGTDLADLVVPPGERVVLAVPGERVALHWLELPDTLSAPQAAAAARLRLASDTAVSIGDLHVATGPAANGRRCVALVAADEMRAWIDTLEAAGLSPHAAIPQPLLLLPRGGLLVRHDIGGIALVRGEAEAFSVEPGLAEVVAGDRPVETLDVETFEADIPDALAAAPVDLLQRPFGRKRAWRSGPVRVRRLAGLALGLAAATLALQIAATMRQSHAAGQAEREAALIVRQQQADPARLRSLRQAEASFTALSSALLGAIRAAPGASLGALDYRQDGSLRAIVRADSAATAAAISETAARTGFGIQATAPRAAGAGVEIELRIARQ